MALPHDSSVSINEVLNPGTGYLVYVASGTGSITVTADATGSLTHGVNEDQVTSFFHKFTF